MFIAQKRMRMRLYAFYTSSHKKLLDEWFLPSLKDDFELVLEEHTQECLMAKFMSKGWNDCMIKKVDSENLVEGDWLYKDIKIKNKVIKSKWDGLSKEEIRLIKMSKKNVLIKQGIPFVPVFLISFLVLVFTEFFLEL